MRRLCIGALCLLLAPAANACLPVPEEMVHLKADADPKRPPLPTQPLPAPVLTQAQRDAALSRLPADQQNQVAAITPTLRHYAPWSDAESMRFACDLSPYGCALYGAMLHLKPVQVAEGVCLRTRRWVSLDPADLPVVSLADMPPALAKIAGLGLTLRMGETCEDWPEDVEGTRFPLYYDPREPTKVLEWLHAQQLLIRSGQPSALRVTCPAAGKFACATDPAELFAHADLNSIPHMMRIPPSSPEAGPKDSQTWRFALEFSFPEDAEPLRPVILQLPSTGNPELEIRSPSPGCP